MESSTLAWLHGTGGPLAIVIVPVPVNRLSVWVAPELEDPQVPLAWNVVPPSKESWLAVFAPVRLTTGAPGCKISFCAEGNTPAAKVSDPPLLTVTAAVLRLAPRLLALLTMSVPFTKVPPE